MTRIRQTSSVTDEYTLVRVGMFQELLRGIGSMETALRVLPQWTPAVRLIAEVRWAHTRASEMEERITRKLLVALVGPSGAGKSTLLNALSGYEISEAGMNRPTTRAVFAFAQDEADVHELQYHCGPANVQVRTAPQSPFLQHILLVDTPDTNTTPENKELLLKVLQKADIILAVFNAQNPKIHDNIAFLRPIISEYEADTVIPILNWVDRIEETQLKSEVIPDFQRHLKQEWNWTGEAFFAVSARAAMPGVVFPEGEHPLHRTNDFAALQDFILGSMNRAGVRVDLRVGRVQTLVRACHQRILETLRSTAETRTAASEAIQRFERDMLRRLVEHLTSGHGARHDSIVPLLYQELSKRWWGPIGWAIAFWSRLLSAKRWTAGLLGGHHESSNGSSAPATPEDHLLATVVSQELAQAQSVMRDVQLHEWPPVAEALVSAGFATDARNYEVSRSISEQTIRSLRQEYMRVYREEVQKTAHFLAHPFMQGGFNGPTLFLLFWIVAKTVFDFMESHYLPAEYFRHALITVGLVWGLSFMLFQFVLSTLSGERFLQKTRNRFREIGKLEVPASPWQEELTAIQALERVVSGQPARPDSRPNQE